MRKSFDPTRAAQLQIVLKPGWIFSFRAGGSTHGSPYDYDTHVPLLFWGPAYVGRGEVKTPVEVADLGVGLLLGVQVLTAQAVGEGLLGQVAEDGRLRCIPQPPDSRASAPGREHP